MDAAWFDQPMTDSSFILRVEWLTKVIKQEVTTYNSLRR